MKYDDRRDSSTKRGYGYRWQKASATFLAKDPYCEEHARRGIVEKATVVDHKVPHRLGEAKRNGDPVLIDKAQKLFWDQKNWQRLCKLCHDSWKQKLEKSGIDTGCDVSGKPTDPNHHWNQ